MCGCFVLFVGAAFPRLALVLLELTTNYNDQAFDSFWVGFAGFLFLPYATLFYVLMENWQNGIDGFGWFLVGLGFLLDISNYMGSARRRTVIVQNGY
ncbi:MAG: hypothetical protein QNM02_10630 [Acidimicrobiia bacterium]|nr:hypothetical protein [Acidimicrobiia bacterium]